MLENIIPYIIVVSLLAMMPGADSMIIMKNTLNYSNTAGRITILGIMLGHLFWIIISVAGLAVVIANSIIVFSILKYIGAAYLIYIGIKSITAQSLVSVDDLKGGTGNEQGMKHSFLQGLVSNLFNPKVLLLYITIIPQFMSIGEGAALGENQQLLLLAAILIGISTVWFMIVVELVNLMKKWLKSKKFQNVLSKGAGAVIILFGIRTALD